MFPEYLEEKSIEVNEDKITICFFNKRKVCNCPSCNTPSTTVSTYFTRTIQDLNIIDKPLFLVIKLAKYRCGNPNYIIKTFSERIEELAGIKHRRAKRLNKMLTKFSLTQSAKSTSRICNSINIKVSGNTLLRLSKKWEPFIDEESIHSIGIDDFAF